MARTRGSSRVFTAVEDPSLPPTRVLSVPESGGLAPCEAPLDGTTPLELDIGCGWGGYLLACARLRPGSRHIGIERESARIARIDLTARREMLPNLWLLRCDALDAIGRVLPPGCADRVTVFFPDPWPKRRHRKRRLFSPVFLDALHRVLKPVAGEVQVATDHLEYFRQIEAVLDADARFERTEPRIRGPEEYTDFERLFRRQDLPIGEAAFRSRPPLPHPRAGVS